MAITLTIKDRFPRNRIPNLPPTIDLDAATTTVEDVKRALARRAGVRDANRLGLFVRVSGPGEGHGHGQGHEHVKGGARSESKILGDRRARLADLPGVMEAREILVQDLGAQIDWRTLYIIEYAGPILIHPLIAVVLRNPIYSLVPTIKTPLPALAPSQLLALILVELHFFKREYETIFLHRFSAASMPARLIPKNCGHYWGLAGVLLALFIYGPVLPYISYTATANPFLDTLGVALFVFGQLMNYRTHVTLANLRSPGGTERGIPFGMAFSLCTCPNYFFEIVAWLGILCVTRSLATVVFLIVGGTQMYFWAVKKERNYRREFGDRYKKKRFVLIPGML